ncbi:MAG TPA: S8 family peptidase [Chitinophagaceae bacterium]|nr:S8 family peptidase [Chitinophagaceae bacterium]
MKSKIIAVLFLIGLFSLNVFSQNTDKPQFKNEEAALQGWHLKDKSTDGYYGISLDKAYNFLKSKKLKSQTIIVAVIDSGIDTTHEDLKNILWTNSGEIPGNGIDDDKNGYVDDVHGWNFLGGKNGENVNDDSYEGARIYHFLQPKYEGQTIDESKLSKEELYEYKLWKKVKEKVEAQATEAQTNLLAVGWLAKGAPMADSALRKVINKEVYSGDELDMFEAPDQRSARAKLVMMTVFRGFGIQSSTNVRALEILDEYYKGEEKKAEALLKEPKEYRAEIVKDNYDDINDRYYGNNNLAIGATHGTHVAGIIAAQRNNGKGVDGIADNVRIMAIRAVPNGDEHDKDVALAIRYAVDNGARIINMSFGKSFSPQKKWVDDAVKYAASKNVLLIHAAGNDASDNDTDDNFPNPRFISTDTAINFITVGASSDPSIAQKNNEGKDVNDVTATFSNYGKGEVDVFAPGVKVYSTLPGGNEYGFLNGTSMASPVVAGIAAMTLSYFPNLSPKQLKYILTQSVQKPDIKVLKPGTSEHVNFSEISKSGGVVNAFETVKLASTVKGELEPLPLPKPKIIKSKKG